MRHRASLILVLLMALAVRVIPCDAMTAQLMPQRDCCDPSGCPDLLTQDHGRGTAHDNQDACCAVSDARRQQQESRFLTSSILIAPPESPSAFAEFSIVPRGAVVGHPAPPLARSTPRHILFSVFLI